MQEKNVTFSSLGSVGNVAVITNGGQNNNTTNQAISQGNVSFQYRNPECKKDIVNNPEKKDVSVNISGPTGNVTIIENDGTNNHQTNGPINQGDVQFEQVLTPEKVMEQQHQKVA